MDKPVTELTQQYQQNAEKFEELRLSNQVAKQRISELENDTAIDIDKAAKEAMKLREVINDSEFRMTSITKRQEALRPEIVLAINNAELTYKDAEKAAKKARREVANTFFASDEYTQFMGRMQAMYAMLDSYDWDTFKRNCLPKEIGKAESKELCVQSDLWINDPERNQDIAQAARLIEFSKADEVPHIFNLVFSRK